MMLVRKEEYIGRRNKFTLFVDRLNDSDVTLLMSKIFYSTQHAAC